MPPDVPTDERSEGGPDNRKDHGISECVNDYGGDDNGRPGGDRGAATLLSYDEAERRRQ